MKQIQRSYNIGADAEMDASKTVFRGCSIKFNDWSIDLGGFKEMILPEAWDSADFSDCLAVFNHREENLLGSYKAGTLRFEKRSDGVYTEIDRANTNISNDCAEWVSRGEISTQSFKFTIAEGDTDWTYDEANKMYLCVVKRLGKVLDTSLVTRAAYQNTDVKLRGFDIEAINKKLGIGKHDLPIDRSAEANYYLNKIKNRR